MHLTGAAIIMLVIGLLLVAGSAWLIIILFKKEAYTRERFAFAALATFTVALTSIIASISGKQTIWGSLANVVRAVRGVPPETDPPRTADHVLLFLVLCIVAAFLSRIFEKWDGAVSVHQREKLKYHEPSTIISEGVWEGLRLARRDPAPPIYVPSNRSFPSALTPTAQLAWHMEARELLCLRHRDYCIEEGKDWHAEPRCWIGQERKTNRTVAIHCPHDVLDNESLKSFIKYVLRSKKRQDTDTRDAEFIVAVRQGAPQTLSYSGQSIRIETEASLLQDLVDFSDYYAHIIRRVESDTLPDSRLSLRDVYVVSNFRREGEAGTQRDLEKYLKDWVAESGQRQLALLGEYGQGKSTAALVTAYHIIRDPQSERVPLLIELRGKSPRNMTPEELVSAWAYPYQINPRAVMQLLVAGKLLLILEGFDEMALVGDSEARLGHFRTLWKLCYPRAKILVTGRPNLFLDDRELKAALGIAGPTGVGAYCEGIHLAPFDIDQIGSALRAGPEKTRREIVSLAKKDGSFYDIVARGSLLYVVSQLWEREGLSKQKDRINSALVMDLFIQHSFRRQSEKGSDGRDFMVLNEGERQFFMMGVAAHMAVSSGTNQIGAQQFEAALKSLYERLPDSASWAREGMVRTPARSLRERLRESEDPVQDIASDVRACGILVFDDAGAGALRFAHKSFLEYLVAKVYANHIVREDRELSSAIVAATHLDSSHIVRSPESAQFLSEILLTSLGTPHANDGPVASQLYQRIVVGGLGGGVLGRCRGRNAVKQFARHGFLRDHSLPFYKRILNLGTYTLLFPVVWMGTATVVLWFVPRFTPFVLQDRLATSLATSQVVMMASYFLLQMDRVAYSSVRLWFSCCIATDLPRSDVDGVIRLGRGVSEAIHKSSIE